MSNNKHKSQLQTMLESLDFGDVRSYSGRGMYGKECLAITGANLGALIGYLVESASELGEEVGYSTIRALEGIKQDSLGMGNVYYFPSVEYVEASDENEAEDRE